MVPSVRRAINLSNDLGLSSEEVRDPLFTVDCGHTGITVCNPEKKKMK